METEDLTGKKFNKFTVLERSYVHKNRKMWRCICDCGNIREVVGYNLVKGQSRSCGCIGKRKPYNRMRTMMENYDR
jgi:hypothetical protein